MRARRGRHVLLFAVSLAVLWGALAAPSSASIAPDLTRRPYLTDLVRHHVTVNWATTPAVTTGDVTYGRQGVESCRKHSASATATSIMVGTVAESQWQADLSKLRPDTTYCYRVSGDGVDLLGGGAAPTFRSQVAPSSAAPYSFAVIGDWGYVGSSGTNEDQANLVSQIAASGARFAVTAGDTAYPDGSQLNYGDLQQTGKSTSAIFGPSYWAAAGGSIPLFNVQGNHGLTDEALVNWPESHAVSSSGGRYRMETYCCLNGTTSASYPSSWYAFNAGPARFYVLDASWNNSNVGSGTLYRNDHDYHWTVDSAEYQWLKHDLNAHPRALAFAFFHFPLYTSNATETSDPWLNGPDHLEGLLGDHGVDVVFSGHAHIYERNVPSAAGMPVSYVTGAGGASLEPVSVCASVAAYAIGWTPGGASPGSACGTAPVPTSLDQVYHFLLVTVTSSSVTVAPTDELGQTFDVRSYPY